MCIRDSLFAVSCSVVGNVGKQNLAYYCRCDGCLLQRLADDNFTISVRWCGVQAINSRIKRFMNKTNSFFEVGARSISSSPESVIHPPVSYTHLTLPTSDL